MAPATEAYSPRPQDPSPQTIPFPLATPIGSPFYPIFEKPTGNPKSRQLSRFRARIMNSEPLQNQARSWLSRVRSALRLLIIVLSGSVVCTLIHTLEIYRGNSSLDLRHGELPMTWPARTNLAPTLVLFTIAALNFLASAAIMAMAFKRSFRRPIRSRDAYRIVAGSFGVILWVTALVTFKLLNTASKASLGRYACTNRNVMSNGRYQYRAVCSEQGLAFYLAIGAACAELLTLTTLAITAIQSARKPSSPPPLDRKLSISYGPTGGRYP